MGSFGVVTITLFYHFGGNVGFRNFDKQLSKSHCLISTKSNVHFKVFKDKNVNFGHTITMIQPKLEKSNPRNIFSHFLNNIYTEPLPY